MQTDDEDAGLLPSLDQRERLTLVAIIAGAFIAPRLPFYRCTNPDCRARVGAEQARCWGCDRPIARTILHERDRLDD